MKYNYLPWSTPFFRSSKILRRGRQARNFTANITKILDLKSSSEQIFSEICRWVPLMFVYRLSPFSFPLLTSFSSHPKIEGLFTGYKIAASCPTNILSEHCIKRYKEQKRTLKNSYANCSLQKHTISVFVLIFKKTVNSRKVRTFDFDVQLDQDLTLTYRELSEKSASKCS